MKSHRESMAMTISLIDQFSKLAKSHVENTITISHEIDLSVGPTTPKGCLLGDFESSYPLSSEF